MSDQVEGVEAPSFTCVGCSDVRDYEEGVLKDDALWCAQCVEGESVEPIVITTRKGEKPFPSVKCPRCGTMAHWQGVPFYRSGGHLLITYACVEDDGCGSVGSRPLREGV